MLLARRQARSAAHRRERDGRQDDGGTRVLDEPDAPALGGTRRKGSRSQRTIGFPLPTMIPWTLRCLRRAVVATLHVLSTPAGWRVCAIAQANVEKIAQTSADVCNPMPSPTAIYAPPDELGKSQVGRHLTLLRHPHPSSRADRFPWLRALLPGSFESSTAGALVLTLTDAHRSSAWRVQHDTSAAEAKNVNRFMSSEPTIMAVRTRRGATEAPSFSRPFLPACPIQGAFSSNAHNAPPYVAPVLTFRHERGSIRPEQVGSAPLVHGAEDAATSTFSAISSAAPEVREKPCEP